MESEGEDYDEEEKSDFIYVFPHKISNKKKKHSPLKQLPKDLPLRDDLSLRALTQK